MKGSLSKFPERSRSERAAAALALAEAGPLRSLLRQGRNAPVNSEGGLACSRGLSLGAAPVATEDLRGRRSTTVSMQHSQHIHHKTSASGCSLARAWLPAMGVRSVHRQLVAANSCKRIASNQITAVATVCLPVVDAIKQGPMLS